jgi:tetratricopeptide (TPR) repeat protein
MKKVACTIALCLSMSAMALAQSTPAAQTAGSAKAADLVKQGRQLHSQGKFDDAIGVYQEAVGLAPDSYDAHLAIGSALDLKGDYAEARKHIRRAIDLADSEHQPGVLRSMAMSYAFECKTADVEKYERQAERLQLDSNKETRETDAAGTLNELARIELECGKSDKASATYKEGYELASKAATKAEDKDLWDFRWEHAQARIAARRGNKAEAEKHVAAAKAIWDKKTLPDAQAIYVPYLTGYVAYYLGDYKTALTDLQKADQKDSFILALLAQTEEKLGDKTAAKDYWTKVLGIYSHNPTNAYARPLAKKALGM